MLTDRPMIKGQRVLLWIVTVTQAPDVTFGSGAHAALGLPVLGVGALYRVLGTR